MRPPTTVFLDRDGTLNVQVVGGYVRRPDELALLPGAADAVGRLNRAGIGVVVVTNQRGVSRGLMSPQDLAAVHARLSELLAERGAHVDAVFTCPHAAGACTCRKPATGLVLQAVQADPDIDLARSALVGDADTDIAVGTALGLTTVLLRAPAAPGGSAGATRVEPDLAAAVGWLLAEPAA